MEDSKINVALCKALNERLPYPDSQRYELPHEDAGYIIESSLCSNGAWQKQVKGIFTRSWDMLVVLRAYMSKAELKAYVAELKRMVEPSDDCVADTLFLGVWEHAEAIYRALGLQEAV